MKADQAPEVPCLRRAAAGRSRLGINKQYDGAFVTAGGMYSTRRPTNIIARPHHLFLVKERALQNEELLKFVVCVARCKSTWINLHQQSLLAFIGIFVQRLDPELLVFGRLPRHLRSFEIR